MWRWLFFSGERQTGIGGFHHRLWGWGGTGKETSEYLESIMLNSKPHLQSKEKKWETESFIFNDSSWIIPFIVYTVFSEVARPRKVKMKHVEKNLSYSWVIRCQWHQLSETGTFPKQSLAPVWETFCFLSRSLGKLLLFQLVRGGKNPHISGQGADLKLVPISLVNNGNAYSMRICVIQ